MLPPSVAGLVFRSGMGYRKEISNQEIRFLVELIMRWIEGQTGIDDEI
jgi:hypothetical protein